MMGGLTFRVRNVAKVREAAKAKGYAVANDAFEIGGVTFYMVA